jgi:putative addiction module component (TIGR02574 family)
MSKALEQVTQDAMQLPRPQRLALVRFMLELDSASADEDAESAWDREITARVQAIDEGGVEGIPYEEVLRRLDRRLPR